MKILHTYCQNHNLGDYALAIGVKNVLRKHLRVDLIGETNIQGQEFSEYYINEVVNKKYDLLVVGGGGIIHGAHWPNGWFWLIKKELIKEIKIPFIVYGVGYNYWEEEGDIPQRGIEHLRETYKYAKHFSVRNDGSAERLYKATDIKPLVMPDPGFHVGECHPFLPKQNGKYVVIQLAYDKPSNRFKSPNAKSNFIEGLRSIVKELTKKYWVTFAPHVYEDIIISEEVSRNIRRTNILDFGYFAFDHTAELIPYYRDAEFVIAMRGHGQIIPIGLNVPVISLENHPKHKGLMIELGLEAFNISINEENFQETLSEKIKEIESRSSEIKKSLMGINSSIQAMTNQGFNEITKQLGY